jgi:hypothetical protein
VYIRFRLNEEERATLQFTTNEEAVGEARLQGREVGDLLRGCGDQLAIADEEIDYV